MFFEHESWVLGTIKTFDSLSEFFSSILCTSFFCLCPVNPVESISPSFGLLIKQKKLSTCLENCPRYLKCRVRSICRFRSCTLGIPTVFSADHRFCASSDLQSCTYPPHYVLHDCVQAVKLFFFPFLYFRSSFQVREAWLQESQQRHQQRREGVDSQFAQQLSFRSCSRRCSCREHDSAVGPCYVEDGKDFSSILRLVDLSLTYFKFI